MTWLRASFSWYTPLECFLCCVTATWILSLLPCCSGLTVLFELMDTVGDIRRATTRIAIMSGIADSTREVPSRAVSSRDRLHGARFCCRCIGVQSAYNRECVGLGNTCHFTIVPATCGTRSHRVRDFDISFTTNVSQRLTVNRVVEIVNGAGVMKGLV